MGLLGVGNYIGKFSGQTPGALAAAFKQTVEADGGVVEAVDCLTERIGVLKSLGLWDKASAVWLPHGYKESKLYAVKGGAGCDLGFSRAGTRVRKGASLVEQVPYSLLTRSKDFNHADWVKTGATVTSDAVVAPDGTTTADKLVESTATSDHFIQGAGTLVVNNTYTASVYAKSAGQNRYLQFAGFGAQGAGESPAFDLDAGTVFLAGTTVVVKSATITSIGNGWYKCSMVVVPAQSNSLALAIHNTTTNGSESRAGDGTSGFYIWQAQVVVGNTELDDFETTDRFNVPALDYTGSTCPALSLEPARTNLILRSEEFDNASWTKGTEVTVVANNTIAPDGLSTADKLVEGTDNSQHRIFQSVSVVSGTTYTWSIYAKELGVGNKRYLVTFGSGTGGLTDSAFFDLATGTKVGGSAVLSGIESAGNGYWRIWVTDTATATSTPPFFFGISDTVDSLPTRVGDGVSGFYVFGAQVEVGSYITSYIRTTTATVSRIADSVPALLPKGTNQALQSQTFDHATWTKSGTTITANNTNAPDGTLTADRLLEQATAGGHNVSQQYTKSNRIETYTFSVSVKPNGRDWTLLLLTDGVGNVAGKYFNVTTGALGNDRLVGVGYSIDNYSITAEDNGFYRCSITVTTNSATNLLSNVYSLEDHEVFSFNGDVTKGLCLWGAQLEQGDEATEYVATTTAPVHNGTVIGQTEGTLYFEGSSFADQTSKHILMISDGTNNNRVQIYITVTDTINGFVGAGGVQQALISGPTLIAGSVYKVAITYQTNKAALFVNGTKIGEDLTVTVPLCQQINMAQGAQFMGNGKAWSVLPTALTDAEAIAATTP